MLARIQRTGAVGEPYEIVVRVLGREWFRLSDEHPAQQVLRVLEQPPYPNGRAGVGDEFRDARGAFIVPVHCAELLS